MRTVQLAWLFLFLPKDTIHGGAISGSYLLIRDGFLFGVANCKSGTIKGKIVRPLGACATSPGPDASSQLQSLSQLRNTTISKRNGVYAFFFLAMVLDSMHHLYEIFMVPNAPLSTFLFFSCISFEWFILVSSFNRDIMPGIILYRYYMWLFNEILLDWFSWFLKVCIWFTYF